MKNVRFHIKQDTFVIFKKYIPSYGRDKAISDEIDKWMNVKSEVKPNYSLESDSMISIRLDDEVYFKIKNNKDYILNEVMHKCIKENYKLNFNNTVEVSKKVIVPKPKNKEVKAQSSESNYSRSHLSKDTRLLIDGYVLSSEEKVIFSDIYDSLKTSIYKEGLYGIYVLYLLEFSTGDIAKEYNRNPRTIQLILKKMGLNRDRFEAQAIAKTKRNYKEIANKGRATLLKNNTRIKGSNQEQYLRDLLGSTLPIHIKGCEIIVGINNRSILDDGKEVDIPIIIIKNNEIFKFAIEYDGSFWHQNKERDDNKDELLKSKGYKVIRVGQAIEEGFKTENQIKEFIEESVEEICKNIKNNV